MGKKVYVALVFFFFFVMVLGVTDVVAGVLHRVGYSYYQFILCGDHMRQLSEAHAPVASSSSLVLEILYSGGSPYFRV